MPGELYGISYSYTQSPPPNMIALACTYILPSFILAYFMLRYGFNNPDVNETGLDCYAQHGDNIGYPFAPGKNVTSEFETWFKFGFILNILHIIYGCAVIIAISPSCELLGACSGICNCFTGCGALAWYITGIVFRWRHFGRVCSGEYWNRDSGEPNVYMIESGKVMYYYYIVTWVVMGLSCLIWCCCCVIMNCAGTYLSTRDNRAASNYAYSAPQ